MGQGPGLVAGQIVFPLARSVNVIGRTDRAADIYPDIDISPLAGGRVVSRRHAEISRAAEEFFVADLGSRLGTLVNGQILGESKHKLEEGDALTIGGFTLTFSLRCPWPQGLVAEWDEDRLRTSGSTLPSLEIPLIAQLPKAFQAGQLLLHYQPQVLLATGEISGVEALLRWNNPERGMVSPERYISLAEDTGFIRVLSSFVVEEAAQALKEWKDSGVQIQMGVNLSVRDIEDPDFGDRTVEVVKSSGASPTDFVMEMTESAVMFNPGVAIATLDHMRSLGFSISIDDFGTGQSSLAYLRDLPADEVKLDGSFFKEKGSRDEKIVRSAIELAHALGMSIVAEGVEDEDTVGYLRAAGCEKAQGYFFGEPGPKDEIDLSPRSIS